MNVVLVNPPADKLYLRDMYSSTISKGSYYWPPVDLLVLSGILSEKFKVFLLDANAAHLSFDRSIELIKKQNPRVVIFMAGSSCKKQDLRFAAAVKNAIPGILLVGNGGFLLHNPKEEMEKNEFIDAILLNFISPEISHFFDDINAEDVNNIAIRKSGRIILKEKKYNNQYFSYPLPKHEQLPLRKYRLSHGRAAPLTSVLSSYGCVGSCGFCVSANIPYILRNVENTIEELLYVERLGIKEVFFRDLSFGAVKEHALKLCAGMIKSGIRLSWVCDMRADSIDEERLAIMKEAGCHAIHIGVESANQLTLDKYSKNIQKEIILRVFKLCNKFDIRTVGYFIIGLPGESEEDIIETINFSLRLKCDYASFNFAIPIIGTGLRKECIEHNWISPSQETFDGSFEPVIDARLISVLRLIALRKEALKKFYFRPSYIWKRMVKIKNFFEIKMLLLDFFNLLNSIFGSLKICKEFEK